MKENFDKGKRHSIIIVAEGVGSGEEIARKITELSGIEPRVTVLGHIQRGGTPTHNDRNLASMLGDFAVRRLIAGDSAKACGIIKGELVATDIDLVVHSKKPFNQSLYELAGRLAK
jgi:6-phosphofructokinase 1